MHYNVIIDDAHRLFIKKRQYLAAFIYAYAEAFAFYDAA
jgi:hypothetical protein